MADHVIFELRELYRQCLRRYQVERPTALMCTGLYEAVFPNASESGKLSIARMLQSSDRFGVTESQFIESALNLKAHMWTSDDEIARACRTERLRQEAAPQELSTTSSFLPRPTAEEELAARETRIRELEAELRSMAVRGQPVAADSTPDRSEIARRWAERRDSLVSTQRSSAVGPNDSHLSPVPSSSSEACVRQLVMNKWQRDSNLNSPASNYRNVALRPTAAVTTRSSVADVIGQSPIMGKQFVTPGRHTPTPAHTPTRLSRFGSLSRVLALEKQATADAFLS
jgi:hypothetical protein